MPVRVDIPTRIRVDVPALTERRGDIEEAAAAAAGRALRASAAEVLEPRGGYVGVRLNEPEFAWSGDGLGKAPPGVRDDVEAALRAAIAGAVRDAGLPAAVGNDVPPPLAEPPLAPVDENRMSRAFGLYELPAYAGGGKKANVPVNAEPEIVTGSGGTFFDWWQVAAEDAVNVYDLTLRNFSIDVPEKGFQGPIFRDPRRGLVIYVFEYPEGKWAFESRIDPRDVGFDERGRLVDRPGQLPPMAPYSIDFVASPGDGDLDTKLADHYRPIVEAELTKRRRRVTSDKDFKAGVENAVKAKVAADRADMAGVMSIVRLRVGTKQYLIRSRSGLVPPAEMQNARLVPLVHPIEPPRAGEPGTGGGMAGKGAGAGAGDRPTTTSAPGGKGGEKGGVEGAAPVTEPPAFIEMEGGSKTGPLFPPASAAMERVELVCEPYLGEPSMSQLGADGKEMKRIVDRIAWLLQIQPCEFAGHFLLNAAEALGGRATQVALWEVTEKGGMQPAQAGGGNVGNVQFIPVASPQIQFLRHLATVVPLISQVKDEINRVYRARADLIEGVWKGKPLSWLNRWKYDFVVKGMERHVGLIFVMTCNVIFRQLLNTSRENIDKRDNPGFFEHFRKVVLPQLVDIDDLLRAREIVRNAELIAHALRYGPSYARQSYKDVELGESPPAETAGPPPQTWVEATEAVVNALGPPEGTAGPTAEKYQLLPQDDGAYRVRDKQARVWSLEAVEMTITMRRGALEEVEPLAKQFTDLPEVVERYLGLSDADADYETHKLLAEMRENNQEQVQGSKDSLWTGFRASSIIENLKGATVPKTNYALQGIHKEAHDQIGEFFGGDPFYRLAIESVFASELGRKELASALEFSVILLVSVVCPPVGAGMAAGSAIYHYHEATERRELYQSLIDPEKVLSAAEVEAGLFAAKLGLALAIIPVGAELGAGAAMRGLGRRAGVEAAEEAGEAGGGAALRAMTREIHLERVLQLGIAEKIAVELTTDWLVDKVMSAALDPIMKELQKEWGATGPIGGLEGAMERLLQQMARQSPAQVDLPPVVLGGRR